MTELDRSFSTAQAADFLGISERTLTNARYGSLIAGRPGPRYRKIGSKCVYSLEDLREWRSQFELANSRASLAAEG